MWRQWYKVNEQDFLQVFQSSGIGKMEDNLTSTSQWQYPVVQKVQKIQKYLYISYSYLI